MSPLSLSYEGQQIQYNELSNVVSLEIRTTFNNAGRILEWDQEKFGMKGFGVNQSIIKRLIELKAFLRIIFEDKNYWLNWDIIESFVKDHNVIYEFERNALFTFPVKLFSDIPLRNRPC